MKKKRVLYIIKRCYERLEKERKLMIPGYEAEGIHRFRVAFKKLRALLKMMSILGQRDRLIIPKKLLKAYRLSGTVRDLQLQQQRTSVISENKTVDNPGYRKMLQRNMEKSKEQLSRLHLRNLIAKSERKSLSGIHRGFRFKNYRKFLETKWMHIKEMIASKSFSDTKLHKIRKELKELSYICIPFGNNRKYQHIPYLQKMHYPSYKERLEKLGNFQDLCNAIRLLSPITLAHLSTQEKKGLKKKRETWLREKASLKRLLAKELKTMLV